MVLEPNPLELLPKPPKELVLLLEELPNPNPEEPVLVVDPNPPPLEVPNVDVELPKPPLDPPPKRDEVEGLVFPPNENALLLLPEEPNEKVMIPVSENLS